MNILEALVRVVNEALVHVIVFLVLVALIAWIKPEFVSPFITGWLAGVIMTAISLNGVKHNA